MDANKARLHEIYTTELRPLIKDTLGLSNIMAVPRMTKVVLNIGAKDADTKMLQAIALTLGKIAGQAPVRRVAKKSIAGFKIREGMQIGVCVTLRGKLMYEFIDKLINLALPRVRDFQGVPTKLDGQGNYNLGIRDWSIFPEAETSGIERISGLNVTFHTTAKNDLHGFELIKKFGMPFRKQ